jgi:Tol biopolymer transport system component
MLKFVLGLLFVVCLPLLLLTSGLTLLIGRALPPASMIAYSRSGDGIYVLDVAHRRSERLVADGSIDVQIAWSPDGESIAYVSRRHGSGEIYVASVLSPSTPRRITRNSSEDNSPTWSADSRWIGFVSSRTSSQDIFVVEVETGRVRNLTQNQAADFRPSWSPAGNQIAFVSRRDDNYEVYLFTSDCLHQPLTCHLSAPALHNLSLNPRTDETPSWSRDGRWLAFVSLREDHNDVYVVDTTCVSSPGGCIGQAVNVTRHAGGDTAPVWSPRGDVLLFTSGRDRNTEIYAIKLRCLVAGELCDFVAHNLSQHSASDYNPAWSPDGDQIAFISSRDGGTDIYTLDAACLWQPRRCPPAERLTINSGAYYPVWRP